MARKPILLLVLLVGLFLPGCMDPEMNSLWRQGYGYNNPNPDRIRQGLPPKDF